MPAGRAGLPALTDAEVAALRSQLERGRNPRVRLRAGGAGTVIGVGDPAVDGPEYIRVKVTLNGTRDTLPFAPEDLVTFSGGAKASRAGSRAPSPESPPAAPPASTPPSVSPPPGPSAAVTRRRQPRNKQPRAAPNVVITLRTAGEEWRVDATRDGAMITEGVAVPAEVVHAVADHLHDTRLSAAVADVAAVRRAAAAVTVERLRAELAAAEDRLTSYTANDAGRNPAP